jgi:DNA-directed RNA polymerase
MMFDQAKPLGSEGLDWLKVHLANFMHHRIPYSYLQLSPLFLFLCHMPHLSIPSLFQVHLANLFGHNKITRQQRIDWTDLHLQEVSDSALQPLDGSRWWAEAENPFQALAACGEIHNALSSGNPSTYTTRLPVHQDGSCNGLQHYAGLGRDELGAAAVNLVPFETPQDVYSNVLEKVIEKVARDALIPLDDANADVGVNARLVQDVVSRKVIKQTGT